LLPLYLSANIFNEVDEINKLKKYQIISFVKKGNNVPVVIQKDREKTVQVTFERYLNNDFSSSEENRDLIIVKSGSLRGTGVLITKYRNSEVKPKYLVWLPTIRKIRKIYDPLSHNGFGVLEKSLVDEVKLRTPENEYQKVVSIKNLKLKIERGKVKKSRYSRRVPRKAKIVSGKFYIIEATPKKSDWYDKRVSFVYKKRLLEYKTIYFKDGQKIAEIYRDFIKIEDNYISNYRYSKNYLEDSERVIYIPKRSIVLGKYKKSFWNESSLTKIKR
jgi:hypothetical protein